MIRSIVPAQVPGAVEFIDVIPKAASGKILRRKLRDAEKVAAATAATATAEEGVPDEPAAEPEPEGAGALVRGSTLVGTTTAGYGGDEEEEE